MVGDLNPDQPHKKPKPKPASQARLDQKLCWSAFQEVPSPDEKGKVYP